MTRTIGRANDHVSSIPRKTPFLEPGDCLSRAEFERRYEAMPDLNGAELIERVVHMPSPVRLKNHGKPHALFTGWLVNFKVRTVGVEIGDNATVRLDPDNELQPDGFLFIETAYGGKVRISPDDYVEGAPELVAEVAGSSASIDMTTKLRVYRRNGVQEYIVWRVLDRQIDWFTLYEEEYQPMPKDTDGYYRSQVFPGLWLDVEALLRDDMAAVLQVLERGLASPEHGAFVQRLQKAREQSRPQ